MHTVCTERARNARRLTVGNGLKRQRQCLLHDRDARRAAAAAANIITASFTGRSLDIPSRPPRLRGVRFGARSRSHTLGAGASARAEQPPRRRERERERKRRNGDDPIVSHVHPRARASVILYYYYYYSVQHMRARTSWRSRPPGRWRYIIYSNENGEKTSG